MFVNPNTEEVDVSIISHLDSLSIEVGNVQMWSPIVWEVVGKLEEPLSHVP